MELHVWDYWHKLYPTQTRACYGKRIKIPYGLGVLLPGHIVHAGGYKSSKQGNLRAHMYIAFGDDNGQPVLPIYEETNYGDQQENLFSTWCRCPETKDGGTKN